MIIARKKLCQLGAQAGDNVAEHIADDGPQEQQDSDDHNGHEHEDQRVLNQTLALLTRKE
jgi:hypothetical protein